MGDADIKTAMDVSGEAEGGAIRGSSAAFVFRWLRGGPEVRIEPGVRAVLRLSHDDRSGAPAEPPLAQATRMGWGVEP